MNKIFISLLLLLSFSSSNATTNIWIGGSSTNNWSDAGNWSGGSPGFNDTVFFDAANISVNIDIAPNIAGLQIINGSNVTLSAGSNKLITIGNLGVSGFLVFYIDPGSSLTLQGNNVSTGVSIQTYGNFTTTRAIVAGTLVFGTYNCSWTVNSFPASFCTTSISGIVRVFTGNTGSVISGGLSNGNPGTVSFLNGALLEWLRNGGSAPNANFMDGSVISIKGITGSNLLFNNSAKYNGLVTWNCTQQTISGGNALLLPAAYTNMDSVRIISTGSGSLRFATNPNGYSINSLEVNNGTVELSAPNSNTSSSLTDTITEFKITGGIVYGNATYNFDNLGAAYPNSLFVNGNFTMTGGILDFTNRTAGNLPGGAFTMHIKGSVLQTGGHIKATQTFGNQNQIELYGTTQQGLMLTNLTDTVSLKINNAAGVNLQDNILIPYFLDLHKGYLQLNQYDATIAASRITQAAAVPLPRIVTNGNGKLIIGNLVSGTQLFPVAPFASGYNPVTINNNSPFERTFSVKVEYGIHPDTVNINIQKLINRTWTVNVVAGIGDPGPNDGQTGLTFQYADSEKVSGAIIIPAAAMMLGHHTNSWDYDPALQLIPSGGPANYTVGQYFSFLPDSEYILGNTGFINSIFIFTGDGNWNNSSNWINNMVPPDPLPAGKQILIDPTGSCLLNIPQTISAGSKIVVGQNKNFVLPGNLIIQ